MSRIGKMPIKIPSGVKVNIGNAVVNFEGPKGKISKSIPNGISVKMENGQLLIIKEKKDLVNVDALFGLTRALFYNCVHGVHAGFEKKLEINGVGYRAQVQGSELNLTLGFSHPVNFALPQGITAKVEANTKISLLGADRELVGSVAAQIKSLRPVEPYKGKGIRYQGQHVRRKQGKAATAK